MLVVVAPIPFDAVRFSVVLLLLERVDPAHAPCGFFTAEVRFELRCLVEGECLVLCAARWIHCFVVPVSIPSSTLLHVRLKSSILPYCLTDCITGESLMFSDSKLGELSVP